MGGILINSYRSLAETTFDEVWKDIDGFRGIYQVSNAGRVRSITRKVHNYMKPGRYLKQYKKPNDYLQIGLVSPDGQVFKHVYVHRLVAQSFIPNPNNYSQINHKNFDKEDNRAENLEWVSPTQNILHFRQGELARKYDEKKQRKLATKSLQYILDHKDAVIKRYLEGHSIKEVSDYVGIGRDRVSDILKIYGML